MFANIVVGVLLEENIRIRVKVAVQDYLAYLMETSN